MGCSSSKSVDATADDRKSAKSTTTKMASKKEYREKSEMPLNETLRQPPKRIQQMMQEAASSQPLTLEELEDKQQRAEQRRQELMQQKLEIIQKNAQMLMRSPEENPEDEQENPENPD
ncbi:hypothetical protein M5D96_007344 [Drosophila gunungcola]|uniref:Uncharacterized protein n=1 Tax=Drosophila gunungcola TaxID=103775 RepID=A0A9Q0BQC6_9MUSC|nr:hypothetical protein M5D96_007344 [Drosophila gunungcola]